MPSPMAVAVRQAMMKTSSPSFDGGTEYVFEEVVRGDVLKVQLWQVGRDHQRWSGSEMLP
jgi:hypothetical protein